jgi:type IV secretory pathway VirB10-like protein
MLVLADPHFFSCLLSYALHIRFGLGISQVINRSFSARVEYQQVNYQNTSTTFRNLAESITKTTNIAPTTRLVEFALIYQLG